ncbi:MAG: S8 family peptidase [Clostridium sp.]|nr:S8 family peptidase [Clostridium sp.]
MSITNNNLTKDLDCIKSYISNDYINLFVKYDGNLEEILKGIDYACAIQIGSNIYLVSVKVGNLYSFYDKFNNVLNLESNFPYTLSDFQPVVAANITKFHSDNYLGLRGTGTIAAIIDTGIDYLNPQFWNNDNTSRIRLIWDQTIQSETPYNERAFYGTVYTQEQINSAISAHLAGKDPYEIVPSKDELGHGTNMAGLVGAKGLNGVLGGAPECEFIIVKLKEAKDVNLKLIGINNRKDIPIYEGLDIFNGINFLAHYQDRANVPMSVLISCGTNWTSHQGMSSLESYINFFSSRRGLVFATNTGNQGASETHASGTIKKVGEISTIEINIAPNEKNFVMMVWIPMPNKMTLSIVSPTGEVASPIQPSFQVGQTEEINLVLENSLIRFTYNLFDVINGNEVIYITIDNPRSGIWQLRLTGDYIVDGNFNIWLPQRPLIEEETRFINADPYITLMSPSIANKAVTTSFYNQNNNTIDINSGRGYSVKDNIKPNLTTGGIEALTTGLNNETISISGGSVAGAVLCSAILLLLQWGIIQGNDPNMYSTSVISYLTRGTNKRPGDIYPNPQWGYGMLNLQGSFENLRCCNEQLKHGSLKLESEIISDNNTIFIPHELYNRLL